MSDNDSEAPVSTFPNLPQRN